MKFLIVHGTGGNPNENWFPWLKKELENQNHQVLIPQFPLNENQNLDNWLNEFEKHKDFIDRDTILIGHSLGPAFILTILEKLDVKVKASILVSSFLGLLDNEYFDNLNKTFVTKEFDWNKIRDSSEHFYMISSDSDPYIPIENPKKNIASHLDVEVLNIKDGGHLNLDAGFERFDFLLDVINLILHKKKP